jgi:GNAT superfamily N-acetyltransferase
MKIRLLELGDEPVLIEATRLVNEVEITDAKAAALLADPSYLFVVALTDDGSVMGRIYANVLHRHESTDLLLYEVDTLEAHRRKGAARAMIDFLGELSRLRGYGEMWVLTEEDNAGARALYKGAGGVEEGSPAVMYVFQTRK